jgi:hypothetical protein
MYFNETLELMFLELPPYRTAIGASGRLITGDSKEPLLKNRSA